MRLELPKVLRPKKKRSKKRRSGMHGVRCTKRYRRLLSACTYGAAQYFILGGVLNPLDSHKLTVVATMAKHKFHMYENIEDIRYRIKGFLNSNFLNISFKSRVEGYKRSKDEIDTQDKVRKRNIKDKKRRKCKGKQISRDELSKLIEESMCYYENYKKESMK